MCDWMEINNNIQELQEGATFPKRKKKSGLLTYPFIKEM